MLLTSWIRALRQSFTRRRFTRSRRQPAELRQQTARHSRFAEVLEERSLLSIRPFVVDLTAAGTNLFISTTSTPGIEITNAKLDPDNDGVSNYDVLVIGVSQSTTFEKTLIQGTGIGISINLSNLTGLNHISIDNVDVTAGANQKGISITLDNVALQSLAVDQITVAPPSVGSLTSGLDISLKNMSSTAGVDVSIQNSNIRTTSSVASTAAAGINISLESVSKITHVGELTLADSTVDGMIVATSVNSILTANIDQASARNNRLQDGLPTPNARGITYNLNRTTVGDLRVEDNVRLRNVAITATNSPLHSVSISDNQNFDVSGFAAADAIRDAIRLNAVSTSAGPQRSDVTNLRIVGNTITGNLNNTATVNGISLILNDSNLGDYAVANAGAAISGNTIQNLSSNSGGAKAISITATATAAFVAGNSSLPLLLDFDGDGTANDTNGITNNTLTANNGRGLDVATQANTAFLADVTENVIDGALAGVLAANRREGVSMTFTDRPTIVLGILTSTLSDSATSLTVFNATTLPAVPFAIQIEQEQMLVTARTGNTLTVTRGINGTAVVQHTASAAVPLNVNSAIAVGSLSSTLSASAVTFATANLPTLRTAPFQIQIEQEQMLVTAVSGNTLTVTRGINGTTAVAHNGSAASPLKVTLISDSFDSFGLSFTGNSINNSAGTAVGLRLQNTAIGAFNIRDNEIINSRDSVQSQPDGLSVILEGTSVTQEATNILKKSVISGNYIGITKPTSVPASIAAANNGDGIFVNLQELSSIQDLHIRDNFLQNNAQNGLSFVRQGQSSLRTVNPEAGQTRAVTISGNTIGSNLLHGIQLDARNGSTDLLDFILRDNLIGTDSTDAASANNLGNRGDGINLLAQADARLLVDMSNNTIRFNGDPNNNVTTLGSGINALDVFGDFTTDKRQIGGTWISNTISDNRRSGIVIRGRHGLFDEATGINTPLVIGLEGQGNTIENNGGNGIRINEPQRTAGGAPTITDVNQETRSVAQGEVSITDNVIRGNSLITLPNEVANSRGGIFVMSAKEKIDIRGNQIESNFGKGIDLQVVHAVLTLPQNFGLPGSMAATIRDNVITNQLAGGGEDGDGIELSGFETGQFWSFDSFYFGSGFAEAISRSDNSQHNRMDVLALNNLIDSNAGRGVDVLNIGNGTMQVRFGDNTQPGRNIIVNNQLDGFRAVNTGDRTQTQDGVPVNTGNFNFPNLGTPNPQQGEDAVFSPDMMLDVSGNTIRDNGESMPRPRQQGGISDVNGTGLVVLAAGVGSGVDMLGNGGLFAPSDLPFFANVYPNEVGRNSGHPLEGNGRINLRVTENTFNGNFGNDISLIPYIAVIPPTTNGIWQVGSTPPYVINRMVPDPLARVNAVVTGNTGNGLDVIRVAPDYINDEPVFKSRLNSNPPRNPVGPFGSGTRPRNATRLATDAQPFNPALGYPFVYPGSDERFIPEATTLRVEAQFDRSGNVFGFPFFNESAPGPGSDDNFDDQVTVISAGRVDTIWDTVSLASFTYPNVDSPSNLRPEVTPFSTPRNSTPGIVTVNFSEYVRFVDISDFRLLRGFTEITGAANTTPIVITSAGHGLANGDRVVISGVTGNTAANGLFTVDNVTANTFDLFKFDSVSNTLVPVTGNGLYMGGGHWSRVIDLESAPGVPLGVSPVGTTQDPDNPGAFRSFQLDLTPVTSVAGDYQFQVLAVDSSNINFTAVRDIHLQLNGQGNSQVRVIDGDGVLQDFALNVPFRVDTAPPVAIISSITPNPRNSAAGIVTVNFNEPVSGVDITDFELYRTVGGNTVLVNLGSIGVTAVTDSQYTLNLNQLSGAPGTYELRIVSTDPNTPVLDFAGNPISENVAVGIAASETWSVDTTLPFVTSMADALATTSVSSPVNVHPSSIIINFSEPVTFDALNPANGVDVRDFSLLRTNADGTVTPIDISAYPFFQLTSSQYELNLGSLPTTVGTYRLTANPLNSGITDLAGNAFLTSFTVNNGVGWFLDSGAPIADVVAVAPNPRQTPVDALNTVFSKPVNGVNLNNAAAQYVMSYDDGTIATSGSISDATNVTSPAAIVITSAGHGLVDGERITIYDVQGNTNANGVFIVQNATPNTFELFAPDSLNVLQPVPGSGIYTTGGRWTRTVSIAGLTVSQETDTRYVLNLSLVTLNQGTYIVSLLADGTIKDVANNSVATLAGQFNVADQVRWTNGPDAAPTGSIIPITTPRGTNAGLITIDFSELLDKSNGNPVDFTDFKLSRTGGTSPNPNISLSGVTITQIGPTTYTLDLSAAGLTDADGTYTLQLLNANAVPASATVLKDLTGNPLSDDNLIATPTGIASQITWMKDSSLSGPQVTSFTDVQRATALTSSTVKLRAVQTLEIKFTDDVQGIDLTDASKNFQLTRQATGGVAIPVSLDGVLVQQVTPKQYRINLSTLTGTDGQYAFTVLANGLIKNTAIVPVELKNPQTVTWKKDGTMRPAASASDAVDPIPGNEVVGGGGSVYSLRAAIQEANALAGDDIIELGAGIYYLKLFGVQEDAAASGDLDIRENLTIRGKGAGVTIIDLDPSILAALPTATNRERIFQILSGATVTIQGVAIQNGAVLGSQDGGAIFNAGNLTILDSLLTKNSSQDDAGAINNAGTLTIGRTTISANSAKATGGAIRNTGTLNIFNSTLSGNTSLSHGGALMNVAGTTSIATLEGVTISGNIATSGAGGGIRNDGTLRLINDTIAFNRSLNTQGPGAGISRNLGSVTIGNTIVSDNSFTNSLLNLSDLGGAFVSLGGNIIQTPGTATGFTFGPVGPDFIGNPNLQPLANYGGPTSTHTLLSNSIAIDSGLNVLLSADTFDLDGDGNFAEPTPIDQRGGLRTLDGPTAGSSVDIGAVEFGTFFVNTTDDTPDVLPGDGLAQDGLTKTSLRAAIMESNALAGESAIILDGKTYRLSRTAPDTTPPIVASIKQLNGTSESPITNYTTGSVGPTGVLKITFSEETAGLNLAHLTLTRRVGAVTTNILLTSPAFALTPIVDPLTNKVFSYSINLSTVTNVDGFYSLTVNPTAVVNGVPVNIRDVENLTLLGPESVNWVRGNPATFDIVAPTVSISPITISPVVNAGSVTVTFSKRMASLPVNSPNLTLTRNGVAVPFTFTTDVTAAANFAGRTVLTLNLQNPTDVYGNYTLSVIPTVGTSSIRDTAGNILAAGQIVNFAKVPDLQFQAVTALPTVARVDEVTSVKLQFSEPVGGVNLNQFTLQFDDGSGLGLQTVPLTTVSAPLTTSDAISATLSPTTGTSREWTLTFNGKRAARDGHYVLSFDGAATGTNTLVTATLVNGQPTSFTPTVTSTQWDIGGELLQSPGQDIGGEGIGDLDIRVGAGRVQIFGVGRDATQDALGNNVNPTIIDGQDSLGVSHDRLFDLTVSSNVAISKVDLRNGKVVYERVGGAFRNLGTLTLNDDDVQGSVADGNGGAIFNAAPAGQSQAVTGTLLAAIDAVVATIDLASVAAFPSNAPFIILVDAEQMQVTVVNAATNQFTVSRGFNGSIATAHAANAVVTLLSSVTVNRTNVLNNAAGSSISGSFFGKGGAIYNEQGAVSINDGFFSGNTAFTDGGAIFNGNNGNSATVSILSATLSQNLAGRDGGAIYSNDTAILTIGTSELSGNVADSQIGTTVADGDGDGGAIYNEGSAVLSLIDSQLTGNSARNGGGLYNDDGSQDLDSTDSSLVLIRDTFGSNTAVERGGAIYNTSGGNLTISQGLFTTNKATLTGGAIQNYGLLNVIAVGGIGTQFLSNEAESEGGAIYNEDGTLTLTSAIFTLNRSRGNAGVISNQGGSQLTITRGLFDRNSADDDGGVLYNDDLSQLTIDEVTFSNNTSNADGGAIYNNSSFTNGSTLSLTIDDSTFNGNSAVRGGAIFNSDLAGLTLQNSTLSSNVATASGGGLANFGSATLLNDTLYLNDSMVGAGIANNVGGIPPFGALSLKNTIVAGGTLSADVAGEGFSDQGHNLIEDAGVGTAAAYTGQLAGPISDSDTVLVVLNIGAFPAAAPFIVRVDSELMQVTAVDNVSSTFVVIRAFNGTTAVAHDPFANVTTTFQDGFNGNIVGANPQLDILRNNGGPTLTHALLFGSPARDSGDNFATTTGDQRGFNRVFDGDGNGVATIDIGAFESGFVVNSFDDTVDQNPGDGINADANGESTLRAAIMEANARPGEDTIILGPGIFRLTLTGRHEDGAPNVLGVFENGALTGDLDVQGDLNIIGAGTDLTFIDANQIDRILQVFPGVTLNLSNLTLRNGNATSTDFGGAILNQGQTNLENVHVVDSMAGRGGGIYNDSTGTLTINNSLFRGNLAVEQGGAVYNDGDLTVTRTDIGAVSRLAATVPLVTGRLQSAVTANSLTVTLVTASAFTGTTPFVIQVDSEQMLVTNVLGNTFTVTRGYGNTTPAAHSANATVTLITATVTVEDVSDFPNDTPFVPFVIQVDAERMRVTSVAGQQFTVERGYNGTVPTAHTASAFATLGNFANIHGGGIFNLGVARLTEVALSGNLAQSRGGGLYNAALTGQIAAVRGNLQNAAVVGALQITLANAANFPNVPGFTIQVDSEQMLVTNVAGNVFTVTRGANGTAQVAHAVNALVTLLTIPANSTTIALNNVAAFAVGITVQVEGEKMLITGVNPANNTLNVQRGAVGTTAAVHPTGAIVTSVGANSAEIRQSTFLDNFASARGAAIFNEETLLISNSTISNNDAGSNAGLGNTFSGVVTIVNSTVIDNAAFRGGGLSNSLDGTVNVKNTIVANNSATTITGSKAPNVRGRFNSQNNNFIGNNADSTGFANTVKFDQVGSGASPFDPVLRTLADNGGFTQTHTARTGSPIIDAGDNTGGDEIDQRGATRPTNDDSDVGSVEQQDIHVTINDLTGVNAVREGDSGTTVFTFTLSLNRTSIQEVRVNYTLQGDTAFANEDFVNASGVVVFAPNQLNQTLSVLVNGDTTIEGNEQFFVNLTNAVNATLDKKQAIGTILTDDTGFRILDVNKVESDNAAATTYTFRVSMEGAPITAPQTVNYIVSSSSSTVAQPILMADTQIVVGNGYVFPSSGEFTIQIGSEQMRVTAVNGSTFTVTRGFNATAVADHVEGLPVTLVGASTLAAGITRNDTTITVASSATFPSTPSFVVQIDAEQILVTALPVANTFTVVRGYNGTSEIQHAANAPVTLIRPNAATGGAAAGSGIDFVEQLTPASLTFMPVSGGASNPAAQTITVTVFNDQLVESNENFFVHLFGGTLNFESGKNVGIGTIFNDDLGFKVSSPLVPTQEGTAPPNDNVAFTVSLQQRVYRDTTGTPVQATVTANVATADGSATSGSGGDYTTVPPTAVTFSGTTTNAQVLVPVLDDLRFESNETFQLRVEKGFVNSEPEDTNAVLGSGTGTISDNDPPPDQWRVFLDAGTSEIVVNFSGGGAPEFEVVRLNYLATASFEIRGNRDGVYVNNAFVGIDVGANAISDDLFIVDFTTGLNPIPVGGMTVHGLTQNGADSVEFRQDVGSAPFGTVIYDSFGPDSGRVTFDGFFVDYDGLEPVEDKTLATNRIFNAPVGGSDNILLSSSGDPTTGFGSTTISSAAGLAVPTFEKVTFRSEFGIPTNVTVNGGTGANNIVINGGDSDFPLALTVNGGNGNDTINLTGWSLGATVFGQLGNDSITGGSGANAIDGGDGNDTIIGGSRNDTIFGQAGMDNVSGGGGDDLVAGGDDADTVLGGIGNDILDGGSGNDSVDGGADDDTVDGGADDDIVGGGDGNDTVLGNDGNDTLTGGNGNDSLDGGFGDDSMAGNAGTDTVNGQMGNDIVEASGNANMNLTSTQVEVVGLDIDQLVQIERAHLIGGAGANLIDASTFVGAVTVEAGAGNDTVLGGLGNDSIVAGDGNDSVTGNSGNDTINGGIGNDKLFGEADDDSITGDAGTDTIDGGAGNDFADGGANNDMLTGGDGIDTLRGGADNDTLTGGDSGDSLLGDGGQDIINGDNGDDTIDGGDGDDTAFGDNGNDFVGGGAGNDTLEGNLGDDSVNGMDGNDTLDGNTGFDTLFGGTGDDEMISNDGNDQLLGQGGSRDTFTFNGDALIADIFTITLAGNGFSPPTGIALARLNPGLQFTTVILGVELFTLNLNGGNDLVTIDDLTNVTDLNVLNINGGDGDDTIDGSLSLSTTVAMKLFMGLGNDSVQGTAAADTIQGDAGNDTIIANDGADSVIGGDGNDSLNGNGGNDTINGGNGNDSIWGGAGTDSILGLLGLDTIWGQGGNDTIDGGDNDDFLDGGYGNSVTAGSGNDSIIGGAGNDKIAGRDGLDKLFGNDGNDTIIGGADNDNIDAGNGNDLVEGDDGNDTINGGAGNDILLGGTGNDSILGGAGNDTLVGEAGKDTVDGQGGTDTVLGGNGLGTNTLSIGEKRIGEKINELFKITSIRASIFNELNF